MSLLTKFLLNVPSARHGFATHAPRIGLLGVPYNRGIKRIDVLGTELAPNAIRDGDLEGEIKYFNEHVDYKDFGDLRIDSTDVKQTEPLNMHHYNRGFQSTMHRLSEKVCEIRKDNRVCVALGGDHALAVGKF